MEDNKTMVTVSEAGLNKLKSLKIAYKKKHGRNVTFIAMVAKLIDNAKLKDIE